MRGLVGFLKYEVWTRDNLLHIAAGLPVVAILYFSGRVVGLDLPLYWCVGVYGLLLYVREVVQVQTTRKWARHYKLGEPAKMNGKEGWLLNMHHNAEWMVPTAALFAGVAVLEALL